MHTQTLMAGRCCAAGQLAAVHLVDALHCADAGRFVAAALLSLQTMLQLELPHINVLSKADLVDANGTARGPHRPMPMGQA
jgi:hypothetical protein